VGVLVKAPKEKNVMQIRTGGRIIRNGGIKQGKHA